MKWHGYTFSAALLATLAACNSEPVSAPPALPSAALSRNDRDDDFDRDERYRDLLPLARLAMFDNDDACDARPYRAFDFWVGHWNVVETGKTELVGTNVVTQGLRGCVVEEHWSDIGGVRGRSLNAYDATTKTWTQLWMDQSGGALLLAGTGDGRRMQLAGTHQTSRVDPTPQTDRITWTIPSPFVVRQLGELATDGGPFVTLYDLAYRRVFRETAITPSADQFCESPARPRFHAFDFLVGSWRVGRAGSPVKMHSTVSKDLGGCLVEERMSGPGGYQAVAYSGFRSATFVWNWMFMDNRGVQLILSGPATLTGTTMTLTGKRIDRHGRTIDVSVDWEATDATHIEQRWSFSTDGGTTWSSPIVRIMTRQ